MTRRAVALALVRTPRLRPELRLPPLRRPDPRTLALASCVAAVLLLAYAVARETSVFAVRSVVLTGASAAAEADAREALRPLVGTSLVQIDAREVERRLAGLPTVRSASVDRSFPDALRVRVTPERPIAVYRNGRDAWLVAESGRIIAAVEPTARPGLPRIRIPEPARPAPGQTLAAPAGAALAVLEALPRRFPVRVLFSRVERTGEVAIVVEGWVEVRLGDVTRLHEKLAGVGAVLRTTPAEERAVLGYLDASVPERVVSASNYQPESESSEFDSEIPANAAIDTTSSGA